MSAEEELIHGFFTEEQYEFIIRNMAVKRSLEYDQAKRLVDATIEFSAAGGDGGVLVRNIVIVKVLKDSLFYAG